MSYWEGMYKTDMRSAENFRLINLLNSTAIRVNWFGSALRDFEGILDYHFENTTIRYSSGRFSVFGQQEHVKNAFTSLGVDLANIVINPIELTPTKNVWETNFRQIAEQYVAAQKCS